MVAVLQIMTKQRCALDSLSVVENVSTIAVNAGGGTLDGLAVRLQLRLQLHDLTVVPSSMHRAVVCLCTCLEGKADRDRWDDLYKK